MIFGYCTSVWAFDATPLGLTPPVLTSPADSTEGITPNQSFEWESVTGATEYEISFSTSVIFANNVQTYTLEATTFTPHPDSLSLSTEYFWRVRASNDAESSGYSPTRRFITVVGVPVLTAPANGATDVLTMPTLQWQAVPGATAYLLELSDQADFSTLIRQDLVLDAQFQVPDQLNLSTTYFWRVRVDNGAVIGAFTDPFSFITAATGVARESDLPPPDGFALAPVYPNPTSGRVQLAFTLPVDAYVTLNVFDVTGRNIAVPVSGWRRSGRHTLAWTPPTLAKGVYFMRLQMGPYAVAGSLVVQP